MYIEIIRDDPETKNQNSQMSSCLIRSTYVELRALPWKYWVVGQLNHWRRFGEIWAVPVGKLALLYCRYLEYEEHCKALRCDPNVRWESAKIGCAKFKENINRNCVLILENMNSLLIPFRKFVYISCKSLLLWKSYKYQKNTKQLLKVVYDNTYACKWNMEIWKNKK